MKVLYKRIRVPTLICTQVHTHMIKIFSHCVYIPEPILFTSF